MTHELISKKCPHLSCLVAHPDGVCTCDMARYCQECNGPVIHEPTRPIFTAGKPTEADAWVEKELQKFNGLFIYEEGIDWLRTALLAAHAHGEKVGEERGRERVLHALGLWWINDNIGVSSKAIFIYMTQHIVPRPFDAPWDASDRKRCVMLLRAIPEWVDRLSEIEEYKIEGTSNGKKVTPWNEQIPLIRDALALTPTKE